MIVSTRPDRISGAPEDLSLVRGGGASAEARDWLAGRLRWEARLQELEQIAGHTPSPPARLAHARRRAG